MTEEEIASLRESDVVLIRVQWNGMTNLTKRLMGRRLVHAISDDCPMWVEPADVVSVERRALAVGDRVYRSRGGPGGIIKAIDGDEAWITVPGMTGNKTCPLSELVRQVQFEGGKSTEHAAG